MAGPATVALFLAIGVALSEQPTSWAALAAVLAVGLASVLAVRRVGGWPLVAGLAVVGAAVGYVGHGLGGNLGWFGLCIVVGWSGFATGTPQTALLSAAACALLLVELALDHADAGWGAWIAGTIFTAVSCALGRRERLLAEALHVAQSGLADRARAEERNRIAGEMHDVIGHAMTVSLLHVSSARLALEDGEIEEARASLAEAEQLTRDSLDEVRATVGLMRTAPADGSTAAPMPGTGELTELVDSFRRAGVPVTCEVQGDPARLPATTGLAAYRIVQEALTNAARHAAGAPTTMRVEVGADQTRLTVHSAAPPPRHATPGNGLLGMRERAEAVGGRLTAGPAEGGWRVEAVMPT